MTELRVTHDPVRGLSYIYLVPIAPHAAVRQRHAGPDIILDFDRDGHLLGIELLRDGLLHPDLLAHSVLPGQPDHDEN